MAQVYKQTGEKFFPGMGSHYLVGLQNVGVQAVDVTLGIATAIDNAVLVAAPSNSGGAVSFGPVVHSFGTPPSAVIPIKIGNATLDVRVSFQYVTADNSAVYLRAHAGTMGVGFCATKVVMIR